MFICPVHEYIDDDKPCPKCLNVNETKAINWLESQLKEVSKMKVILSDIWLCSECMIAAVNDDYSGLSYHLNPTKAKEREDTIRAGLITLGPNLVPDFSENEGYMRYTSSSCDCCQTSLYGERYRFAVLGEGEEKNK